MPVELFADAASTTVASIAGGTGVTSFTVTSSTGFPSAVTGVSQFRVLIGTEMVTVINVSGTTWTCSATAAPHAAADVIAHILFASSLAGLQYPRDLYSPAGFDYSTVPRIGPLATSQGCVSGTLYLLLIALPAGYPVGHIGFFTQNALASPTNCWFGLYDLNCVQLALTADQGSAAWAGLTLKSLAIATTAAGAASSFVTTYSGLYYLGIMIKASTPGSLVGGYFNTNPASKAPPIVNGFSDTVQTTPPAFAHTALVPTSPLGVSVYGIVGT